MRFCSAATPCNESGPNLNITSTTKFIMNPHTGGVMNRLLKLIAASALVLITVAAHAVTSPVGATPGTFVVSASGAATYSIPIQVPPGINGMQPDISLVYNSQAGNGIAGVGWGIGGLSAITRCGATMDRDGIKGGVSLDATDKFCLDGQRLVAISGAYGANGTEYRTEIESFSKIISYGVQGTGPAYFGVWNKLGEYVEYGNGNGAQQFARNFSTVYAWSVSKIQNTLSDSITYLYTTDSLTTGQHRILEIDYTLRNGAAVGGVIRAVKFNYTARSDAETSYVGGGLVAVAERLSDSTTLPAIQTFVGSTLVRSYRLTYTTSSATNRSRLASVQECAWDAAWVCLSATTLGWQEGVYGFPSTYNWLSPSGYGSGYVSQMADFNGDGKSDIYLFNASNGMHAVWLSQANGTFASTYSWASAAGYGVGYTSQLGDFNGDGKIDIFLFNASSGTHAVWLNQGNGTFASTYSWVSAVGYGPVS